MKKIIKLGLVSLLAVMVASCSSNNTEEVQDFPKGCPMSEMGPCPKMKFDKKQCKENFEKWAKFDSLSEDEQKALIKETKKAIDDRQAKRKAYRDSIEALWNDFDNLSLEQQKDLLMKKMHGPKPHGFHKGPKPCNKDFHKGHGHKGPRPEGPCPNGPRPHGPRPDAPAK